MRYFPGYTLENIRKLTVGQFNILLHEINVIAEIEAGGPKEKPMEGKMARLQLQQMFGKDSIKKRAK